MLNYLILGALFFVLSPGNFLTLPRGGSKRTVALVHAVVFVVAYYLTEKVAEMSMVEGFQAKKKMKSISTMEQLQHEYSDAKGKCIYWGELKDKEYNKGRTNTRRFIQVESSQRQSCDTANELRNKLRNLGVEVEGFQKNLGKECCECPKMATGKKF
jgi:hypothetical protein